MSGGGVKALAGGLAIMKAARALTTFGVREMAEALGEASSTVCRWMATLEAEGWLEQFAPGRWRIGREAADTWTVYRKKLRAEMDQAREGLEQTYVEGEKE